jgi:hypothetical protein
MAETGDFEILYDMGHIERRVNCALWLLDGKTNVDIENIHLAPDLTERVGSPWRNRL